MVDCGGQVFIGMIQASTSRAASRGERARTGVARQRERGIVRVVRRAKGRRAEGHVQMGSSCTGHPCWTDSLPKDRRCCSRAGLVSGRGRLRADFCVSSGVLGSRQKAVIGRRARPIRGRLGIKIARSSCRRHRTQTTDDLLVVRATCTPTRVEYPDRCKPRCRGLCTGRRHQCRAIWAWLAVCQRPPSSSQSSST